MKRLPAAVSWRLFPVLGLALFGAALVLIPLLATVWLSFIGGSPGQPQYTLENYANALTDPFGYRVLLNTSLLAVGSTVIAIGIGAPLAWAVARTDLPLKHFVTLMMGVILVVPGFIQGIGWAVMLSPTIGLINVLFTQALGFAAPPLNIYTLGGMTVVQGLDLVPPAFFMLLPVLMAMDASLEEAAYLSGAGKMRTFLRINLPLALPAIVASSIYVLVLAATLFEVPVVLGFPERIFVFSTLIYLLITPHVGLPAYGLAGAYGSIIVLVSLLMARHYARVMQQGRRYATITGKGRRAKILSLGKWRSLAVSLAILYLGLALGLPFLTLIYFSLLPFFQVPSWRALESMTIKNYVNLADQSGLDPFINTGLLITMVPLGVVLLSIPISWIVVRSRVPGRFVIDNIAFLPFAVPRIVLAVAILYLGLLTRHLVPIYGTILIIALAHIIMFMSFATRTLNGAMIQIHPDLEEAGRTSGASLVRVLRRVTVPLLKPAVFFAWFWVLLLSLREVTVAVMLSSPDNIVLPVLIFTRWQAGRSHEAAAAAVVFVLIACALLFLLRRRVEQASPTGGVQG
ncbi:MAG: iron ABC transporter permease [Deltaproteobacteria bacterium]|nr:iron ABC transporter permease [Deltaproteobacteria bacterium]